MKIVIIHGQNHAGSTCMVARELAHKVGGEIQEFFLPRDFDQPCLGCHLGFVPTDDEQSVDGLRFTPMQYSPKQEKTDGNNESEERNK